MSIQFSNEMLQQLISKAILEGIPEEQRNGIIQSAVASLLKVPEQPNYGKRDNRTVLQRAFDDAIRSVAVRVATEEMSKPENIALVSSVVSEAVTTLLSGYEREKLVKNLAEALASGFQNIGRD